MVPDSGRSYPIWCDAHSVPTHTLSPIGVSGKWSVSDTWSHCTRYDFYTRLLVTCDESDRDFVLTQREKADRAKASSNDD